MGHLPSRPPFSLSLPSAPAVQDEEPLESRLISNPELLKCLGDQTTFYDLYVKLTNRAIDVYAKAGRRKFALRLHGSLAALDLLVTIVAIMIHLTNSPPSHRGRFPPALQTYSSLPAHYSPHKWTSLECYMLSQAINVYAVAGTARDKQWVNIVLTYLKLFSSGFNGESLTHREDNTSYVTNLVDSLKAVVDELSERL